MFTKKNPKTYLIEVTSTQIKHALDVNIITGKNMTHVDLQLHKKCNTITTNINFIHFSTLFLIIICKSIIIIYRSRCICLLSTNMLISFLPFRGLFAAQMCKRKLQTKELHFYNKCFTKFGH